MKKSTTKIELVETHNLALCLNRLSDAAPYDCYRWKRALYHALSMSQCTSGEELTRIREALKLP